LKIVLILLGVWLRPHRIKNTCKKQIKRGQPPKKKGRAHLDFHPSPHQAGKQKPKPLRDKVYVFKPDTATRESQGKKNMGAGKT